MGRLGSPRRDSSVKHGPVLVLLLVAAMGPGAPAHAAPYLPHLGLFPRGECTRWAYERRPDIVDRAWTGGMRDWNAWRWAGNARRAGYRVDRRARAGTIAVWPRWTA